MFVAMNLEAQNEIEQFATYVKTKDEHKLGDESTRLFPTREQKSYIWDVIDALQNNEVVLIEKSRQLMLTWICCLFALWTAKYNPNRLIYIQSKKEESAANIVFNTEPNQARISFIESHLPKELQSKIIPSYGKLIFTDVGSTIQGIPEGGDQIRSYTPSLVISDEAAFQPEFESSWAAIMACITGGGKFIGLTTANTGSYFKELIKTSGMNWSEITHKGIKHYKSDMGIHCIRVHYTADPDKDPDTEAGKQWFDNQSKLYGGVKSAAWQREMEIDWDATGGDLVFPQFKQYEDRIVITPFEIPESWKLYGVFDYGHRNPSAFEVFAIDHDGNIYSVWEYYMAGQGYRRIAQAIRACQYFDKLEFPPIADPSIFANNQQVQGGDGNVMKSIGQIFFELPENERIMFIPGKKGGDITMAEKINGLLWNEEKLKVGEMPQYRIFKTCPMLIWEISKIRYREYTAVMLETHNLKEELVDKDNHAIDCTKMFMTMFFGSPKKPEDMKLSALQRFDPNAAEEWKAVQKMHEEKNHIQSMGEFL
jgi:hypothetical protein